MNSHPVTVMRRRHAKTPWKSITCWCACLLCAFGTIQASAQQIVLAQNNLLRVVWYNRAMEAEYESEHCTTIFYARVVKGEMAGIEVYLPPGRTPYFEFVLILDLYGNDYYPGLDEVVVHTDVIGYERGGINTPFTYYSYDPSGRVISFEPFHGADVYWTAVSPPASATRPAWLDWQDPRQGWSFGGDPTLYPTPWGGGHNRSCAEILSARASRRIMAARNSQPSGVR